MVKRAKERTEGKVCTGENHRFIWHLHDWATATFRGEKWPQEGVPDVSWRQICKDCKAVGMVQNSFYPAPGMARYNGK